MIGFEEITIRLEHKMIGKEFEKKGVIRKTDIESIYQTTNLETDALVCVITMKSGSEFSTNESYQSLIKRLLPQK